MADRIGGMGDKPGENIPRLLLLCGGGGNGRKYWSFSKSPVFMRHSWLLKHIKFGELAPKRKRKNQK